ncbi:MAG: SDR family oxidoreductase [Rhizobiaceae bacterium]|nr:SDR family oxidoreductase [Rhizobiaceae bacterium]
MTELRLKDRVAVVTGGAQGIGFAIAERLAREGALLIIADVNAKGAKDAAERLKAAGYAAEGIPVDISSDASVAAFARALDARHGRCEILVNNAAISDGNGIKGMSMERYAHVININQHGAVRMSVAMIDLILKAGPARRIVNIASIMGVRSWPDSVPYSTAKGAIVNFTRAMACDLATDGVTVNALCPGFVNTPMSILPDGSHEYDSDWFRDIYVKYGRIPFRRWAEPEDIAGPAYFFCSDDARYVTGQVLLVDGGASATF